MEMTIEEALKRLTNVGLVADYRGLGYVRISGGVPLKAPSEFIMYPFQISYEPDEWVIRCHVPKPNPNEEISLRFSTFDAGIEKIISLYENCRIDWEYERDNIDPNELRRTSNR